MTLNHRPKKNHSHRQLLRSEQEQLYYTSMPRVSNIYTQATAPDRQDMRQSWMRDPRVIWDQLFHGYIHADNCSGQNKNRYTIFEQRGIGIVVHVHVRRWGEPTSSNSIHPLLSKVGQDLYTQTIAADRTRTATQCRLSKEETQRSQEDVTSSKSQPSCSSPEGWTRPTINLHVHADNCSGQNKNCYIMYMYEGSKKLAGSVGLTPPLRSTINPYKHLHSDNCSQ